MSLNLSLIDSKKLAEVTEKIGLMHDLGKASTYFQEYIKCGYKTNLAYHSYVSAIITYINFQEWKELSDFAPLAFKCVQKHHSDLSSFLGDKLDNDALTDQTLCIYNNLKENIKTDQELNNLLTNYNIRLPNLTSNNIKAIAEDLEDFPDIDFDDIEKSMELFLLQNLLFSILIDADKHSANRMKFTPLKEISSILNYSPSKIVAEKNTSPDNLTSLRNKFLNYVNNNPYLSRSQKLYSLTAPTGSGKTFACMEFADVVQHMENKSYRVIYCLPYTSIIDQNYKEFEKVLKSNLPQSFTLDYRYLVKHHHLVDYVKTIAKENDYNIEDLQKDILFIESWESGCIISTFVQLFHSIIGNKNSMIRKFHNIINSIILLDEVQNLPPQYYCLLQVLFKVLAEKFNTYILSCSATQPYIYSKDSYSELAPKSLFNIADFNRVLINIFPLGDDKAIDLNDFCDNYLSLKDVDSVLIVMNTKRAAIEVYNYISSHYADSFQIYCLTTLHIPKDRQYIIEEINALLKNKTPKVILVSTQLIEAGVDLSFKRVYRDFGPLDSIIQVAGRCNRHNEYGELGGEMFLLNLKEENKILSNYVYDKYILQQTEALLRNFQNITSNQFEELVNLYYNSLNIKGEGEAILNAIKNLNYDEHIPNQIPIKCFKLIKDDYATETLYLLTDEMASETMNSIIDSINRLKNIGSDKNEFFNIMNKIKQDFRLISPYEINLTKKELDLFKNSINLEKLDEHIYFVEKENIAEFYDLKIGLNLYSFETSGCLSL